VSDQ
jgi:hypothetical protein